MTGHPCTTLLVMVTGRDPLGAVELGYRRAEPDIDAVLAVYLGEEHTDHEAVHARVKCGCSGMGCGMMTVTSQPYSRAAAAVSSPTSRHIHDDDPTPAADGLAEPIGALDLA